MKILYFRQHFSTPNGTVGIRAYVMVRELIKKGHEVTLVCGSYKGGNTGLSGSFEKGKREGVVNDIHVIEFDLSYSNDTGFLKRTLLFFLFSYLGVKLALTQKYDVIFATTTPLTAGIPGIFARWFRKKPFIFEVRDLWPELPKAMGVIKNPIVLTLMSILEWVTYKSATRLIGLSPGIVNGIARLNIDLNLITMIPNGCDLTIFSDSTDPWRPKGVKKTDLMVVFTGTHGIANGLDAVLDVALELKKRKCDEIKIVLMGQGKLKSDLQLRAKKEQLTNIIFHDPVDKKRLSNLFASADLGLQILANIPEFYYGTSPNKFFDYIAAGLPVLTNYPGWVADIIKEYNCGIVIPPENSEEFANALERFHIDKTKVNRMSINAKKLAKDKFDLKDLSNDLVVIFEDVNSGD